MLNTRQRRAQEGYGLLSLINEENNLWCINIADFNYNNISYNQTRPSFKKQMIKRHAPEKLTRTNYYLFSTYSQSGGHETQDKIWQGYTYRYIGIFGRLYLHSSVIIN